MRTFSLTALLLLSLVLFTALPGGAQSGTSAAVAPTEISADQGGCWALITVTGADAKPIYNAKIATRIRYGVMGVKKLDLETFTNVNGQAKFVKLPESPKKPIYFYITKDDKLETVEFKPDVHCHANFDVQLK